MNTTICIRCFWNTNICTWKHCTLTVHSNSNWIFWHFMKWEINSKLSLIQTHSVNYDRMNGDISIHLIDAIWESFWWMMDKMHTIGSFCFCSINLTKRLIEWKTLINKIENEWWLASLVRLVASSFLRRHVPNSFVQIFELGIFDLFGWDFRK